MDSRELFHFGVSIIPLYYGAHATVKLLPVDSRELFHFGVSIIPLYYGAHATVKLLPVDSRELFHFGVSIISLHYGAHATVKGSDGSFAIVRYKEQSWKVKMTKITC